MSLQYFRIPHVNNFVHSGVECKDEILSCSQASAVAEQQQQRQQIPEIQEVKLQGPPASAITPPAAPPHPRPQPATAKIFAPRTEEMNKGFLMFSEEEPGLTSKSNERSLVQTELAPSSRHTPERQLQFSVSCSVKGGTRRPDASGPGRRRRLHPARGQSVRRVRRVYPRRQLLQSAARGV